MPGMGLAKYKPPVVRVDKPAETDKLKATDVKSDSNLAYGVKAEKEISDLRDMKDNLEVVEKRIENARGEMARMNEFSHKVINDDIEQAHADLNAIVEQESCRASVQVEMNNE